MLSNVCVSPPLQMSLIDVFSARASIRCSLMTLTDVVPRGLDMETVKAFQYRSVHRRNFQTSPDRVGVDVGRKSDYLRQIEPTREQGRPCEPLFDPPF